VIVTVYSRPECHLCDEAIAELEQIAGEVAGMELEIVDIDRDDDLLRRYLERIPVVAVAGRVLSELVFDRAAVMSCLGHPDVPGADTLTDS
jgi:thiol-disulfide isomerase/thioredoxin